ncbi:MAG: CdiI family contact-dependent growth inhibition immunity protein [Planctomycetota bacterium]|jgi:hypothetical protein|nr:CdiI family contact-dependent growth inhibition immunity protein [Planctomycetota bacterium]
MRPEIRGCINIYRNEDFLVLAPLLGSSLNFDLLNWYPTDLSHEEMGRLAFEGLDESYKYTKRSSNEEVLFESNYNDWVRFTKEKFKYKSDRAMFTNMCSCLIARKDFEIEIRIPVHKKMKTWYGLLESKKIPHNLDFFEFGSEIRHLIDRAYAEEFS